MTRRSAHCGTKNIQFVKNDLSLKISMKNVLFLKRNNGIQQCAVATQQSMHTSCMEQECNGNGSCVVHYIPVSVARYLLARLNTLGLCLAKGTTSRDNLLAYLCCLKAQSLLFNSFSLLGVLLFIEFGALNHLVMKYNHNNLGLMATQNRILSKHCNLVVYWFCFFMKEKKDILSFILVIKYL